MESKLLFSVLIAFFLAVAPAFALTDAAVTGLTISPTTINPATNSTISISVKNIGDSSITSAEVRYEALLNSIIVSSDSRIISLSVGESQTETFYWIPGTAGNYTIRGKISAGDENSTNDYSEISLLVENDYRITDFSISPATLYINELGVATQNLFINGFVKLNGVGTSDNVLIYVNNSLRDLVKASSTNSGYFNSTLSNLYFGSTGTYTITAKLVNESSVSATSSLTVASNVTTPSPNYNVDIEVDPDSLTVYSGDVRKYNLTLKNTGNSTDTYTLSVDTTSAISSWFDFSTISVTLSPGDTRYLNLWVSAPATVSEGNYSVLVKATGRASDSERVYLAVKTGTTSSSSGASLFDVEISRPSITPSTVYINLPQQVYVDAEVSFLNLNMIDDQPITVKLYINKILAQTKTITLKTGTSKNVQFDFSINDAPISSKPGRYEIYYFASVYDEADKSPTVFLDVKSGAGPAGAGGGFIEVMQPALNVTLGSTFQFDIKLTNIQDSPVTFALYAKDIDMTLSPNTATVAPNETKIFTLNATLGNVSEGNYTAKIFTENADSKSYALLDLNVAKSTAPTGFITLVGKNSSVLAAVFGVILLAVIFGYYFFTKEEAEPKAPPSVSPASALTPRKPESGVGGIAGIDISRIPLKSETMAESEAKPAKDIQYVLENLDSIKSDFHSELDKARAIKQNLNTLIEASATKSAEIQKQPWEWERTKFPIEKKPASSTSASGAEGSSEEYLRTVTRSV